MTLPNCVTEALRKEEKLLWVGQPRTDFLLVPLDWIVFPPFLLLLALALGLVLFQSWPNRGAQMVVAAGMFLIGFLKLTRFPLDRLARQRTYFFVTDRRICVRRNTFLDRTVYSLEFDTEFRLVPIDGPHGTTTIYFGSTNTFWDFLYPPNYPLVWWRQPLVFYFLDNGVEVMNLITEARQAVEAIDNKGMHAEFTRIAQP